MFDSIKLYTRSIVNGVSQGLRAATSDFSDGYKSVTAEGELIVAKESKAAAKKAANTTKSPTSEMLQAIKQSGEQVEELQRVVKKHGAGNHSKAFKAGRWMRNPLINTWKFVKSLWNTTSTTQKIISAVAVIVAAAFTAIAVNTLGAALLCSTVITAASSIAFSRMVFIKYGISATIECIVDVTIFVAYTMYILS